MLLFGEGFCEEEHLVVDGIGPVFPCVGTWANGEIVWDFCIEQRFVQIAVHFIEEVGITIVNDDVLPGFERGHKVDDGVLCPCLLVGFVFADAQVDFPLVREFGDVNSTTHTAA